MVTNNYNVMITPIAKREMNRIYEYISEDLELETTTKKLMLYIAHMYYKKRNYLN